MPNIQRAQPFGNFLRVQYDDGTADMGVPDGQGRWLFGGNTVDATNTPPDPSGSTATGTIYNPWKSYNITGTWADHMSYSAGGIDYPLPYGTPIYAPATGTLHTSGGSGEYACGWVGSAGRRSILYLDADVPRVAGRALEQNEGSGAMHAIVFQHQSSFGTDLKHYAMTNACGKSGASANGVNYGGDTHLHVHGLNAAGQRVDFLNFIP